MSLNKNIKAMLILEIIGKPAQYLVENLEHISEEINKEKGVKVIEKTIKEPVVMKDNKDFFTTFAEIEVETEDLMYLAVLMFKYMPAHIEVISPEEIKLSNAEGGEILSELARRLHSYDEVARMIRAERITLLKKLEELQGGKPAEKTVKKAASKKVKKNRKKK